MHHLKTCIVQPAYRDGKLYNIKGLMQRHKRQSGEGLTPHREEEGGE